MPKTPHTPPLPALHDAMSDLRHAQDRLHEAVIDARSNGATWEHIGAYLGISRQAAQQRYAASV